MPFNVTEQESACRNGPNTMTADLSRLMPKVNKPKLQIRR